jgi:hypothetical protein
MFYKTGGSMAGDKIIKTKLYHEVKKIWNGIVSVGSYTFDKCKKKKLDLVIWFKKSDGEIDCMTIPFAELDSKVFSLHDKVIQSKFGEPYSMKDFKWRPDEKKEIQKTFF